MICLDLETIPIENPELVYGTEYYDKYKPKSKSNEDLNLDALNVDFGQIACIGICQFNEKGINESKMFFPEMDENYLNFTKTKPNREAWLLGEFWDFVKTKEGIFSTVTFNGLSFDLPFLLTRSLIHEIIPPVSPDMLSLRKYTYRPHFDIMQALSFWGATKFKSLDFYTKRFKIKTKETCKSSEIYDLWKLGEYQKIAEHCQEDVRKTYAICKKIYRMYGVTIV